MTHPQGSITDLEDLKNIILLGLPVWMVVNDSELRNLEKLELKQGTRGLILRPWNNTSVRVQLLHIDDPSFVMDGQYAESGAYIFDNFEDARTYSNALWTKRNTVRVVLKP